MIPRPRKSVHRSERGYILITLILFVALIAIAAVILAPAFVHQMKRDREEELIHRGVQYSRAMKHFVKKFGRYPTRIEELENSNNVRFLRRRYKDPVTGKDFKILHMGDVQMSFGAGLPGAIPAGGLNPGAPGAPGAPGIGGGPGGQAGVANSAFSTINTLAAAGFNGQPGVGGPGGVTSLGSPGAAPGATASNSDESNGDASEGTPNQGSSFAAAGPGAPGAFGAVGQGTSGPNGQTFGGGPMVGVASTSKEKTIRIFNKKEHYNEWQFIYDPSTDRGGILTTPNQPSLQAAGVAQPGAPGAPAAGGTATAPGGFSGQPGPGQPPGQPPQSGPQTPQMPPDQ
jgi:type II secretory pathway pseudopilin PulG